MCSPLAQARPRPRLRQGEAAWKAEKSGKSMTRQRWLSKG